MSDPGEIVERRVAAAALAIQAQFDGVIRSIDQKVGSNKEQSETRITAIETLYLNGAANTKLYIDLAISAAKEVAGLKFDSIDKARGLQALEYERRLEQLNHENTRIAVQGQTFVRNDLYAKDMQRLENQFRDQQALAREAQVAADTAKLAQETANATNRRNTMLAMMTAAISIVAMIVSTLFRGGGAGVVAKLVP